MLKGTPQAERNNAWHARHTQKKAAGILFRKHSILSGRSTHMASMREIKEADKAFSKAKAMEIADSRKKLGITARVLLSLQNMWRRIKAVFNFSSNAHA